MAVGRKYVSYIEKVLFNISHAHVNNSSVLLASGHVLKINIYVFERICDVFVPTECLDIFCPLPKKVDCSPSCFYSCCCI